MGIRIQPGDKVVDTITGFKGLVVARTDWLYGCVRISVQSSKCNKEGIPSEPVAFDEAQLKLISKGRDAALAGWGKRGKPFPMSTIEGPSGPGGPRPDPQRAKTPKPR